MELLGTLPQSPERDGKELDPCTPLDTAWMALRGCGAPEGWTSLHPALGLAKSLGHREALLPIYHGLVLSHDHFVWFRSVVPAQAGIQGT